MSEGIKEVTELVRAAAVVTSKAVIASSDGAFSRFDGFKLILTSAGDIWDGLAGIAKIPGELRDLDTTEANRIIDEMVIVLEKSRRFTARERDIARKLFELVYRDIITIHEVLSLPPTAELVTE